MKTLRTYLNLFRTVPLMAVAVLAVVFGSLPVAQAQVSTGDETFALSASGQNNDTVVSEWTTAHGSAPVDTANDLLMNHATVSFASGGLALGDSVSAINDGLMVSGGHTSDQTDGLCLFTSDGHWTGSGPADLVFNLDATYNIGRIDSFTLWDLSRLGQKYDLYGSTDGGTTWNLVTSVNQDATGSDGNRYIRRISLTDSGPVITGLAGVNALKFHIMDPGPNGATDNNSIYAEIAAYASVLAHADEGNSTVTASPTSVASDGVTTSTITVTLKDASSNPVSGKTVTLARNGNTGTGTPTITTVSGVTSASGVATFTVACATSGDYDFEATDTTDSVVVTQTATVTFTSAGTSAANSTVAASPTSVVADGVTSSTITVTLKNASGNPVVGKTVTLASSRGLTDTISAASGPSDDNGVVTFTVTSTKAGSADFTATDTDDAVVVTQKAAVAFTPGPVDAGTSTVVAAPASVPADGSATDTITVTLNDAYANPVPGKTVTLALTSGPGSPVITTVSGTTDASGAATFTVKSTTTGDDVFTATDVTDSNLPITQTATVTFLPLVIVQANANGDKSGFSVSATDLVNQGQTTLSAATRSHVPLHSTPDDFGGYDPANMGLNVPYANDGQIGDFSTEPWGKNVEYYPMTSPTSAYPLPVTYTFTLNTTLNPAGYDITGLTSTCGYFWNKDWAANQVFQVEITKDGSTWLDLGTYSYTPITDPTETGNLATQVVLSNAGGGALNSGTYVAQNVTSIRITYSDPGNYGDFNGTAIKEIDVFGLASGPVGPTYNIKGTVTLSGGAGLSGVTVTAGTHSATTAGDGSYTMTGVPDGTYTVTPSKVGYTFTPTSSSVTLAGADMPGVDFTAELVVPATYSISGTVTTGGSGLSGVTVSDGTHSATTAGDGSYTITGVPDGTYTVTPIKSGVTFTPASSPVTVAGADVTAVNFTAVLSTNKEILTFTLPGNPGTLTDGRYESNIYLKVPAGTDVTGLSPTFTHNGEFASPSSGTPLDFTTAQTYTITAGDSSTRAYTVTVIVDGPPVLIGHWASGAESLADSSGYTPAGTHNGVAVGLNAGLLAWSTDVPAGFTGKSLDLTAGSVGVMIANTATNDASYRTTFDQGVNTRITVTCWVKANAGDAVSKSGRTPRGWAIRPNYFMVRNGGIGGETVPSNLNSPTTFYGGAWHHVAVVFNGWGDMTAVNTNSTRKIYVDGVFQAECFGTKPWAMTLAGASHLTLGCNQNNNVPDGTIDSFLGGKLYDVRIYNGALTATEIASLLPPVLSIKSITGPLGGNFTIIGTASVTAKVAVFKSTDVALPLTDAGWVQVGSPQTDTAFTFTVPQIEGETQAFYILKVVP